MSYKLEFETTNNIVEYEALILELKEAKYLKVQAIFVYGDSKLIIQHIRNVYQTKHQRLNQYINELWDQIENFFLEFNILFICIELNQLEDSLAIESSTFRAHLNPKLVHKIQMRYRPTIPDNIKNRKVFEDDQEIKSFIETMEEFLASFIDQDEDTCEKNVDKF